jgi:hypothetical protein
MFDQVSALASHIDAPKGKFIKAAATNIEPEVEGDNIPEETPIKTKRHTLPAAKKLESPLTDIEEPTPEKKGRGLKRMYVMVDITAKNGSDANCSKLDINYEPPTDLDPAASGTETGSINYEMDDAEETPKAKKMVSKMVSKVICEKATGKKSEVVNITGDNMQPEANEAHKMKTKATKQVTKAKGKVVREVINAHLKELAGKKQEVSFQSTD